MKSIIGGIMRKRVIAVLIFVCVILLAVICCKSVGKIFKFLLNIKEFFV